MSIRMNVPPNLWQKWPWPAIALLCLTSVIASVVLALAVANTTSGANGGGSDALTLRVSALERKLKQLEEIQEHNHRELLAHLAKADEPATPRTPNPEQIAEREARKRHLERLRTDPEYALKAEMERLEALQTALMSEPVNPAWASETSQHVDDVIANSVEQAGGNLQASSVDCRTTQCKIYLEIPSGTDYEDILMYMTTDLAEVLPRTRLVALPARDGVRQIHIYAQSGPIAPPPGPGGD